MEKASFSLLSVKIIQITNLQKANLFSQSDCYVSLFLPSASFETARTKNIKDCKDPVWNETFCYRIQNQVKNILELIVHDENHCLLDGDPFTVLFDIAKLQLGETICLTFPLDPKIQENLEVEFSLENISAPPENIVTNGVLVSREISCLEIEVNNMKRVSKDEIALFTMQGCYEESQKLPLTSSVPLEFQCVKCKESALKVELLKNLCGINSCFTDRNTDKTVCLTLPLDSISMEKEVIITQDKSIDLCVKVKEWQKELDVRLDYELCPDEQIFIQKRKKIVAAALKRVLCMDNDLQDQEIPVVAIMATGGGARAFTALHGHLLGLQKLNLLDCLMYISGSSGSTWTLSNLYEDPDWSQKDLLGPIAEARKNMSKCKLDCFTLDHLKEYNDILKQRKKDGYKTCITDLWGLFIDQALGNGRCSSTLSEQKHALNHGQSPLPMYLVLNTRDKYSLQEFKEWMEFTPFEVGLLKYGAYIRAEDYGSKFFMGRMMKKIPESQICFMKGLWSNVFSYNLLDAWREIDSSEDSFLYSYTQEKIKQIGEKPPLPPVAEAVNTYLVMPTHKTMKLLREVITERVSTSEVYSFLNGFQLNNGYLENKNFYIWKDTVLDTFPNQLMTPLEYLNLVDTAAFIDTSYAPLMRPERKADVIIHLNYSSGSQTAPLNEASRYFTKQGIPFPKIDLSREKNLKECYVFEDTTDSKAPIVVFFPLINDTFKKYKAPGMKRAPTELKQGEVDVTSPLSPYGILNFQYSEENFDKLIELTSYNIQNNKNSILQALQRAIERKKPQTK
ncbi:cytosolic phospholipase A2 epsilon-like [Pantherophis guttatus]|uniref:Phospholipase A2 n=1 Tax=Pantherophis guttatus TaxID=94885 RepID=A0A6P9C1W3_PANGU|nr:cytosolic phospholipase A2 epsilon-like [Pantherophis guttatus]